MRLTKKDIEVDLVPKTAQLTSKALNDHCGLKDLTKEKKVSIEAKKLLHTYSKDQSWSKSIILMNKKFSLLKNKTKENEEGIIKPLNYEVDKLQMQITKLNNEKSCKLSDTYRKKLMELAHSILRMPKN